MDKPELSRRYESVAMVPVLAVVPDQPPFEASVKCLISISSATPKSIVNVSSRWPKFA